MKFNLIHFLCFVMFGLLTPKVSVGIAFTDWQAETPCGNIITDNWGPTRLYAGDSCRINHLISWYFYKNHIIGSFYASDNKDQILYFIFNEHNFQLNRFLQSEKWKSEIVAQNLNPVYTRWHNHNWRTLSRTEWAVIALSSIVLGIGLSKFTTLKKGVIIAYCFGFLFLIFLLFKTFHHHPSSW